MGIVYPEDAGFVAILGCVHLTRRSRFLALLGMTSSVRNKQEDDITHLRGGIISWLES